jgi:hypothetical protein
MEFDFCLKSFILVVELNSKGLAIFFPEVTSL